ncbi:hypothetical protein F5X68DRAFT_211368 [Plectosphaerella plurivora]|uniref:Uncharacterized protein n=1 Tax=Plectosphaerella plurivora TaxID=936078 RepID=A0A9P9A8B3_9PEZI|nr:hypothetical protein F5X68DRAFT_211368 [Plectosphaerella plurivora]
MSALSRAFTTRRVKQSIDTAAANNKSKDSIQRSKTTKAAGSMRNLISAPVELIHTTNMLSYNAPDISRSRSDSNTGSAAHSVKSSDEEPDSPQTAASSPPTSPDIGPSDDVRKPAGINGSPAPAHNHLSCYFVAPTPEQHAAPAIPKRSPSHTKQASYDAIARQRSMSVLSKHSDRTVSSKNSMTFSRASSTSTSASSTAHDSMPPSPKPPVPTVPAAAYQHYPGPAQATVDHPFGRELAQVSEIAEDYGIKHSVIDAEEQALKAQGLLKHSPESYAAAIHDLLADFLSEPPTWRQDARPDNRPDASSWI